MKQPRSERGVALPGVLLTVVLAILPAAGFAGLSSERRVHANDEAALDAFTLAETGLELFLAKRDSCRAPLHRRNSRVVTSSAGAAASNL